MGSAPNYWGLTPYIYLFTVFQFELLRRQALFHGSYEFLHLRPRRGQALPGLPDETNALLEKAQPLLELQILLFQGGRDLLQTLHHLFESHIVHRLTPNSTAYVSKPISLFF